MVTRLERYAILQKFECAVGFDVIARPTHCVVIKANCQCRKLTICVFDKAACGLVKHTGDFFLSGVMQHVMHSTKHVSCRKVQTLFSLIVLCTHFNPPLRY